ncbi:MAG: transposase family protein [Snowella sp.]|nr:transposase family protein [Snowella sp.]
MRIESSLQPIAIVEAFSEIADNRRSQGKRHEITICLASFTLAVAAGNQGFIAIGDWLKAYQGELIALLKSEKERLPSYSTIRRVLLTIDYQK